MTVALLLPLTQGLGVTTALIMFAGIYYGGMYGGSTTSILLNTPGESASVVTAIEGNKMARAGRAAQALATAAIGSFVAGTIATLLLALVAPTVADLAVDVWRGGRGEPEGGEDIDLTGSSDWKTIAILAAAFVANALLIEPLGWVFSGAILFWGSAFALGSRHYIRDAVIAFALSFGSWYLFAFGLGVILPVGILKGIL